MSLLSFSPSLMDREVTLFGEMDKVKADASKYCIFQYVDQTKTNLFHMSPRSY